ncbi:MAG: hypothetical protein J2P48_07630 [Alphaproteobacteria bacterium]|nr:hypothetical protein [Alphaproteobacteria bacterium]
MPTSPKAIQRFLLHRPDPPPLAFRGAEPDRLRALIERIGQHKLLVKTQPRTHQLEALAFALWARRAILYYEMRTGKTKVALDWLSYLIYSGILNQTALIIAHAPIGVDEWESQIPFHSHLDVAVIRSGPDSTERFFDAAVNPHDAVIVSWSTLQQIFTVKRVATHGAKRGREKLYVDRQLARDAARFFGAAVIDEIHMAGNHDTLRFGIASELVQHCAWRLGLTGTPFGRDPLLLWAQAFLIDGGEALSTSFHFFRAAFCVEKYNPFRRWSKTDYAFDHKKMPLLRDKLSRATLHCALSDVQDVNVLAGVVRLRMSGEQQQAYLEAVERLVKSRIGDAIEIDNVFLRLRQIASGFLPFINSAGEERIVDWPDAAKFVWLDDFLSAIPDFQVVVFHEFIHTGQRICKLLDKHRIKYEWLHGGVTGRPELLKRFQTGESQVLVANAATGGMSIDLSAAEYLCFFESPVSLIARRQAEARPLARGSRPLVVDDLVCAPIEAKLLDYAAQGANLREALLRDPRKLAEELRK